MAKPPDELTPPLGGVLTYRRAGFIMVFLPRFERPKVEAKRPDKLEAVQKTRNLFFCQIERSRDVFNREDLWFSTPLELTVHGAF